MTSFRRVLDSASFTQEFLSTYKAIEQNSKRPFLESTPMTESTHIILIIEKPVFMEPQRAARR